MIDTNVPSDGAPLPPASSSQQPPPPRNQLSDSDRTFINALLDRSEKTYKTFNVELWTYRVGAMAGVALLIGISFWVMLSQPGNWKILVPLLPVSGVFAATGDRSVKLLREQLESIREVIRSVFQAVKP